MATNENKTPQQVRAERVFNNRGITDGQADRVKLIKERAAELFMQFDDISVPPDNAQEVGRLVSLAKTSLEEAVMWAVKAVSRFSS